MGIVDWLTRERWLPRRSIRIHYGHNHAGDVIAYFFWHGEEHREIGKTRAEARSGAVKKLEELRGRSHIPSERLSLD